jgi:hypothetical protein
MTKPRLSVDKIIDRVVEQRVDDVIEHKMSDSNDIENPLFDPSTLPQEEAPEVHPVIDDFLSRAKEEGYYFKLYKEGINGKNETLDPIERADYETWSDLETDLHRYIKNKTKVFYPQGWGSGKYTIKMHRRGVPGIAKDSSVNVFYFNCAEEEAYALQYGQFGTKRNTTPQTESAKEKIAETAELIKTFKSVTGDNNQTNIADLMRVLNDTQKTAFDTILKTQPQPQKTDTIALITSLLPLLKELGLIGAPKIDPSQIVKDTLSMLKDMGVIGQPKQDDFVSNYLKMKELGLIGKEDATLGMIDQVTKIIESVSNLKGFGGGGGEGNASLGVEIVRNLAPHVPAVVEKVTGAVHDVAEVHRLKLMRSMNMPVANPQPVQASQHPQALPNEGEKNIFAETFKEHLAPRNEEPQPNGENMLLSFHPLVKELNTIIKANDKSKFGYIADKIVEVVPRGTTLINDILSNQLNAEGLQSLLVSIGGKNFSDTHTLSYLKEFVEWIKQAEAVEEGVYIAKCTKCHEEYEYPSKEAFEQDEHKVCDIPLGNGSHCDGKLVHVTDGNGKDKIEPFVEEDKHEDIDLH